MSFLLFLFSNEKLDQTQLHVSSLGMRKNGGLEGEGVQNRLEADRRRRNQEGERR